jgi:hypothetical protein
MLINRVIKKYDMMMLAYSSCGLDLAG